MMPTMMIQHCLPLSWEQKALLVRKIRDAPSPGIARPAIIIIIIIIIIICNGYFDDDADID